MYDSKGFNWDVFTISHYVFILQEKVIQLPYVDFSETNFRLKIR